MWCFGGGLRRFFCGLFVQPRKLIIKVGVGPVVGFGMLFGGLVASVMNPPWTMNVQWTALSISAFTYVVLIGTVVAFWCYLSSLKYVSAVIVGLMVCFEPLSAYLLSVFAFDLRIGLWEAAGICLCASQCFSAFFTEEKHQSRKTIETKIPARSRDRGFRISNRDADRIFLSACILHWLPRTS